MRRSIKQILVGAVAGLAVSAGIAAPIASADYVALRSKNSEQLLEVGGWSTAAWATLDQWNSNRMRGWYGYAGQNQQWMIPDAGQTGGIRNRHSQMCVGTSARAGRAVYQAPCSTGWEQQWLRTDRQVWSFDGDVNSMGYTTFTNPATGLVLDVYQASKTQGAVIVSWYPTGGDNQMWHVDYSGLWEE